MTELRWRADTDLRWSGWALLAAALVLLPWMAVLAATLPVTVSGRAWTDAWIGLDLMEAAGLAAAGWLALRRDTRVRMAASATGALLLADAWFDTMTSRPGWELWQAAALAVCVELPLAALCLAVAFTAPSWCSVPGARVRSPEAPG